MKSLLLAGIMSVTSVTASYAQYYWVTGDRGTGKCNIVNSASQPVAYGLPAYAGSGSEYNTSFASGPYKSLDDAKLARSTITECPQPSSTDGDAKE
jgi:hypothetical protein